jgi:hypothetical protein
VKAGALGVGEIMKNFGLSIKKADGTRLKLDDPELDPVWEKAADLKIPVFIHVADPAEFFQPIDYHNERWLELALYPDRRYQDRSRFPTFEELMTERDHLFMKHPRTTWVIAHFGWHAQDLGRLGRMFDQMPNLYSEMGAVLYDIGRQPRNAHDFFMKYQDRILFGKDSYQPDEYPYYWRVLETNDEYFDYYRDYHAFWKMYGIGLPDQILKKVYFRTRCESLQDTEGRFPAKRRPRVVLSRHRRRGFHRIPPRRRTPPARPSCPGCRQPDYRKTPQSRAAPRSGIHRRRSRGSSGGPASG